MRDGSERAAGDRLGRSPSILLGALAGLVGGIAGAGAMSLLHAMLAKRPPVATADAPSRDATAERADGPNQQALAAPARPQPAAAQPKAEDATEKTAAWLAARIGLRLAESDKAMAGSLVHYGFGGSAGAAYGALSEIAPSARRFGGLPFGAAVWLGAHVITVPALGLAESPARKPLREEGEELALHLVYGLVTETVRALLRARR
jgi:putative membrane protein